MTRCLSILGAFALTALVSACLPVKRETQTVRVLFIGNSYTFQHDVPGLLERTRRIKNNVRIDYQTEMIADGGRNLMHFVNDNRVVTALRDDDWDYVVLQDRSTAAFYLKELQEFDRAVSWFKSIAHQNGAELVLFQTWPRKSGHAFYKETAATGFTPPRSQYEMMRRVASAYGNVARRYGGRVAPVGHCWLQVGDQMALYAGDGSHASKNGARLAVRVIANTLEEAPDPCEF